MRRNTHGVLMALLAAVLFGLNAPASKLLLSELSAPFMASLLYLGAGFGMFAVRMVQAAGKGVRREAGITKRELPYVAGMILLDVAAPILLLIGLGRTTSANASLLNNFEIVATSLIALLVFHEHVGRRMWVAIGLITLSGLILTFEGTDGLSFSPGSGFILLACVAWGFENNLTRMLSSKDPVEIVVIKGLGSGAISMAIALLSGQAGAQVPHALAALALGFVSYGLSIYFYVVAQRELGAARTSAYYAAAPFVGVLFSVMLFGQRFSASFLAAVSVMLAGAFFAVSERHNHRHIHETVTHEHRHNHGDGHHNHEHSQPVSGEHSHPHDHARLTHAHGHAPDIHHTHSHPSDA